MKNRRVHVDILISGAGPVGLTCALLLRNLGVSVAVLEGREGTIRAPQAHVVSSRSLEILTEAGIPETVLREQASPFSEIPAVRWVDSLTGLQHGCFEFINAERAERIIAATPTPIANISQSRLEPLLLAGARKAGAEVFFGHRWQGTEEQPDGSLISVAATQEGEVDFISSFLLACDGASSDIRHHLGIEMIGPELVQSFVGIHFKADLTPLLAHRPGLLFEFVGGSASGFFICHRAASDWVFMHPYDSSSRSRQWFTEERVRGLLREAIGADVPLEISSVAPWRMSSQVADRYREKSIFLLGDAAHRFPPTGGIGMNTGIGDAHNLCWKLGMVLRGKANAALLDTYEDERKPVAVTNARQSLKNYHKMAAIEEALTQGGDVQKEIDAQPEHFDMLGLDLGYRYRSAAIRGDDTPDAIVKNVVTDVPRSLIPGYRLPHAWLPREDGRSSTLGLVRSNEFVLLTGAEGDVWKDVPVPWCAEASQELFERLGDLSPRAAILVRPDGHIAWVAHEVPEDPAAVIRNVIQEICHPPSANRTP